MSEKQVRDYDKFMLRLPEGMREALSERAKKNGRSMNSEIVQILEDSINSKVVSWTDLHEDAKDPEVISMTMDQFNKFVSMAAEDTAKAIVDNLTEKFEFVPKEARPG